MKSPRVIQKDTVSVAEKRVCRKKRAQLLFFNKFNKKHLPFSKRLLQDMVMCQYKKQDIVCGVKIFGYLLKYDIKVTY
jgi:hypothetical protein